MVEFEDVMRCIDNVISKGKNLLSALEEAKEDISIMYERQSCLDNEIIHSKMERIYGNLMLSLSSIYKEMPSLSYYTSDERYYEYNPVVKENAERLVSVRIDKDDIYIKIPLLKKKFHQKNLIFSEELEVVLNNLTTSGKLPHYDNCAIEFTHAYNTDFDLRLIPDNDNIDIKKTIDIVADAISGNDGALSTRIKLQSIRTDEVEQGTYIHVSKYENNDFEKGFYPTK